MTTARTEALYYPHIDLHDEAFLHTLALFWDHVHTIVPVQVRHPYQSGFADEYEQLGLLKRAHVDLESKELEEHGAEVLEYLATPDGKQLLASSKLSDIHPGKLPAALREFLAKVLDRDDIRRLQVAEYADRSRVLLPESFVTYYMTTLATRESRRRERALVTDDALCAALSLDDVRGARGIRPWEDGALVQATLTQAVARGIEVHGGNSPRDVLAFRDKNRTKLNDFRQHVAGIAEDVTKATTPEAAAQRLIDANRRLRDELDHLSERLEAANLRFGLDAAVSATAVGGAVAATVAAPLVWPAIPAAVGPRTASLGRAQIEPDGEESRRVHCERARGTREPARPHGTPPRVVPIGARRDDAQT